MAGPQYIPFIPKSPNFKDIAGQRFGKLTAIEPFRDVTRPSRGAYWRCACDCGRFTIVDNSMLRSGNTKSCGCYIGDVIRATRTKPWDTTSETYHSWSGMIQRCSNPRVANYYDYGGRGITYDPRWASFPNFLSDMGERPPGTSLDRFPDVNGNYCKDNCRWATRREQNNNRRNTVRVVYRGREYTISELAEATGVNRGTITTRLWKNWDIERVVNQPLNATQFKSGARTM